VNIHFAFEKYICSLVQFGVIVLGVSSIAHIFVIIFVPGIILENQSEMKQRESRVKQTHRIIFHVLIADLQDRSNIRRDLCGASQ
jgi:hypothetical protein